MDKQLSLIIDLLEKHKINYWLDSGTLLGLVRDGKLIEGDNDIDIGVMSDQFKKVNMFIKDLDTNNVRHAYYKEVPVKVKIEMPKARRLIDINFFNKENDNFWCIQPISILERKNLLKRVFYRHMLSRYMKMSISIYDKFPYNKALKFGCWWVPEDYFNTTEVVNIENRVVRFPAMKEKYLEERYGKWRQPNPDWNFVRDDGLLLQSIPEEVFRKYFKIRK